MKIVFLDRSTLGVDINIDKLNDYGELTCFDHTTSAQILERCHDATIVITNKVILSSDILKSLPSLRLICIAATGMNNVDLECATELGISVLNAKDYSTDSVVQHTFTMLFQLLGSCDYYSEYMRTASWQKSPTFTHIEKPFFEISGKQWGIIGLGKIGRNVAKIASAFGCEVSFYSTTGQNNNSDYQRLELNDLLSRCDIISIHAPLSPQTYELINSENLGLLKQGAILLNLGRGSIINESDLFHYISRGTIAVGLDVLAQEPMSPEFALKNLLHMPNLFITPHIAWSSVEARTKLFRIICENINQFIKSK